MNKIHKIDIIITNGEENIKISDGYVEIGVDGYVEKCHIPNIKIEKLAMFSKGNSLDIIVRNGEDEENYIEK